jgi:RNA polymerase sigma-70 factor (ECF subfamily)
MPVMGVIPVAMNWSAVAAHAIEADSVEKAPRGMNEQAFLLFYAQTARPLRGYLSRMTGDVSLVEDILQESYFRLLRADLPAGMTEAHRKNYLFRTATNLVRDEGRRRKPVALEDCEAAGCAAENVAEQRDVERFLAALKPRERELLWLAYVEQFSHRDIAGIVGAKPQSIRPMLSRARGRLAEILRKGGFAPC